MDYLFGGDFIIRGDCGPWEPWLAWTNLISHALVGLAYLAIPTALILMWRRNKEKILRPDVVIWFAAFIFLNGVTHFTGGVMPFFFAPYRFITMMVLITALVSFGALWNLGVAVRAIEKMPTPQELQNMIADREAEIAKRREIERVLRQEKDELQHRVGRMEEIIAEREWTLAKRHEIALQIAALRKLSNKPIPEGEN